MKQIAKDLLDKLGYAVINLNSFVKQTVSGVRTYWFML